jgi:PAS domain S-box-containing protein
MLHELGVHQIELEMQNDELRRAQLELEDSRARYFKLYDLAPVGYCTLNDAGQILQANLAAATLLGMARGELVRQTITRFVARADQDCYYLQYKQLGNTGKPQSCELRMVKLDGTPFCVQLTMTSAQSAAGAAEFNIVLSDITERCHTEGKNRRLTRLYAALSQCSKAIVHCVSEEALFLIICRTAVQFGGMKMAWVGLIDPDTGMVRPTASFGENTDYLKDIKISVDPDSPFGCGPTGIAIRAHHPYWC